VRIISCPACDEEIELEPGDEGRRIRCPECNERFVVPNRSRRDEEDERPRRRKKPQMSGPNWAVIGGIAAGVMVLVVGGVVAFLASRPKADTAQNTTDAPAKSNSQSGPAPAILGGIGQQQVQTPTLPPPPPLPMGWMKVTAKEAGLSAYWPGKPDGHGESESDMGGRGVLKVENRDYSYALPDQGGGYGLDIMILPAGKTSLNEEEKGPFLRLPRHQIERLGKGRVTAERSTTLGGAPATEFEFAAANVSGVYRYGFVRAGSRLLFVMAKAAGPKISQADAQTFLDSIRPAE
jgi:DNA-directed RNA polymerase subunit RPC12/RpoP